MISSSCRAEFVHESTTKALSADPGQVRIGVKSGRGGYDFVASAFAESRHCPRGPNWGLVAPQNFQIQNGARFRRAIT